MCDGASATVLAGKKGIVMGLPKPPRYMQKGSKGRAVDVLLAFLDPEATEKKAGPTGIILDGNFGEVGSRVLADWQRAHGIDPDGNCGPTTREALRREGFDFDDRLQSLPEGISEFLQPDGSILYWGPRIAPQVSETTATSYMRRAWHGN